MLYHISCRPIVKPENQRLCLLQSWKIPVGFRYCKNIGLVSIRCSIFHAYQGSNSWMILSNLITAKSLEENPAIHARSNIRKMIKLLMPALLFNLEFDDFPFVPAWTIFDNQKHDTHTNHKWKSRGYEMQEQSAIADWPQWWQHDTY